LFFIAFLLSFSYQFSQCWSRRTGFETAVELNESQTRALLINPLLVNADWKLSDRTQVGLEIPVAGYDPRPWNGITDYCLYHASGAAASSLSCLHLATSASRVSTRMPRRLASALRARS